MIYKHTRRSSQYIECGIPGRHCCSLDRHDHPVGKLGDRGPKRRYTYILHGLHERLECDQAEILSCSGRRDPKRVGQFPLIPNGRYAQMILPFSGGIEKETTGFIGRSPNYQ